MQDRWITDWPVSERWPHHTRSDAGEMLPTVIVSRELGLPCVVSATDATARIPDGALVEVDGDAGQVTVVEVPA